MYSHIIYEHRAVGMKIKLFSTLAEPIYFECFTDDDLTMVYFVLHFLVCDIIIIVNTILKLTRVKS